MTPIGPHAETPPLTQALLRSVPEDFVVEERMPFALSGDGEHLWLRVRKRGFNTEQVARQLARLAGIAPRQVGYAGMKDRQAVTVQWFSLHLPGRADPEWAGLPPGIEVLEAVRHGRKLQRGALQGNRFEIRLRDCQGDTAGMAKRLEGIRRNGVPNYFGEQRFGREGGNVEQARAMFAGRISVRDRHRHGLLLSAARAALFNAVLAERILDGSWQTALAGEACLLAGSNSFFVIDQPDDVIRRRLAEHDVHLSGPMWGDGEPPTRATVQALELAVAARHADLARGLGDAGLRQERRALRVVPVGLEAEPLGNDAWRLGFELPAGSYATAVLRELAAYRVAAGAVEAGDAA